MRPIAKVHNERVVPPEHLAEEIETLRAEVQNERDRNLRTLAEFKNYRRRIERDGNTVALEGKRRMILPLLDIIDDLENALHWVRNDRQPFTEGVKRIHQKLLALLETQGVLPFESAGTPFDPERHDAVAMAEQEDLEPGTVVDELRRGYLWNSVLLRPAQVRVAGGRTVAREVGAEVI